MLKDYRDMASGGPFSSAVKRKKGPQVLTSLIKSNDNIIMSVLGIVNTETNRFL